MTRTVAQVLFSQHVAGTERHVADLTAGLRGLGWRCVVVTGANTPRRALDLYRASADEVMVLPATWPARRLVQLTHAVRACGPDLVHAHLGDAMIASALAGARLGVPVVATAHFVRPRHSVGRGAAVRRIFYRQLLLRMKRVIAISDAVADAVRPELGGGDARLVKVLHGIPDTVKPLPFLPQQARSFVYVGRLSAEKRPEMAIEALARLPAPTGLIVAGGGPLEAELQRLARRLVPDRVRFTGHIDTLDEIYARASAVIMPSLAEPFGLVALEAMRAGRGVIAAASGALPEVIGNEAGILFDSTSVDSLADAMRRVLDEPDLAPQMGAQARARYERLFRMDRMARETSEVYLEVIGRAANQTL